MAIILDADVVIRGEKGTFDLKTWAGSLATFNKKHFAQIQGLKVIEPK